MKKYTKSFALALSVDYALITTDGNPEDALDFTRDDIYATDWMHNEGYKARIEGNTLVVSRDYGWGVVESRYLIIPNVDYTDYRADRNYKAILASARRFAMTHTIAIVHKINAG